MSSIFFNELLLDNVRPRLLHTYMYAQPICRSINLNSTSSKLRIFENSSHTIRADEPNALIDAIVDFVNMG